MGTTGGSHLIIKERVKKENLKPTHTDNKLLLLKWEIKNLH